MNEQLSLGFGTTPVNRKWYNIEETLETLLEQGWYEINRGHFSVVYGHDQSPGRVLKMTDSSDGWLHFANLAMNELRDNPHVPQIDFVEPRGDFYLAMMERLEETNFNSKQRRQYQIAKDAIKGFSRSNGEAAPIGDEDAEIADLAYYLRQHNGHNSIDLHDANVMMRGDTLVITDPFAYRFY